MKRLSFLNQIGAGLRAGFGISFALVYIAFQAELFQQGAESIGISLFGFVYFVGGLITSIILWALSKGRSSAKFLGLFVVTVVFVGSIGLGNLMTDGSHSASMSMQINIDEMARLVAQLFFWGVPALVVIFYGYSLVEAQPNKSE